MMSISSHLSIQRPYYSAENGFNTVKHHKPSELFKVFRYFKTLSVDPEHSENYCTSKQWKNRRMVDLNHGPNNNIARISLWVSLSPSTLSQL